MRCTCCRDRRVVADIEGNDRPCSRCASDAFNSWADARRPVQVCVGPLRPKGSDVQSSRARQDE